MLHLILTSINIIYDCLVSLKDNITFESLNYQVLTVYKERERERERELSPCSGRQKFTKKQVFLSRYEITTTSKVSQLCESLLSRLNASCESVICANRSTNRVIKAGKEILLQLIVNLSTLRWPFTINNWFFPTDSKHSEDGTSL